MIHAIDMLGDVGQADAQLPQFGVITGREQARRQADLEQGGPETVLRMGVISLTFRRHASCRRAAKDKLEAGAKMIW